MFAWMTTIETKQNELDAKFISMLDIQHTQIQALVDTKRCFLNFWELKWTVLNLFCF